MFNLKITEELCVIILKIDAKFEGKITFGFINDVRNLVNFTRTLKNLRETFFSKVYNVELKNYRAVMCHDTEIWCNI